MANESETSLKGSAAIIEHVIKQDGTCETAEEFLAFWEKYPEAPLHFYMRNFNTISGDEYTKPGELSVDIALLIPGLMGHGGEQFWLYDPELQKLLPQSTFQELTKLENNSERRKVYFADIVSLGPLIAKETGRTVTFTRQFGSGDPDQADYEDFGPFYPQEEFEGLNQETLKDQLASSVHMSYLEAMSEEEAIQLMQEAKKMFDEPDENPPEKS